MKESRNKHHTQLLGGIVFRMLGNRTKNLATSKEYLNPRAPLNCTHVPASVLIKRLLAWDSKDVGRGESTEQRGRGLSFGYMKANINLISVTE